MDLDELERLALAATPGPWHADKYGIAGDEDFTTPVVSWDYAWCECADEEANKPYIAAASPDVLLALIARVRAAEAERDRLRAELDDVESNEITRALAEQVHGAESGER